MLLRGPCDKGARIWQRPELTEGAVMALLAPWRGRIQGRTTRRTSGEEFRNVKMVQSRLSAYSTGDIGVGV